MEIKIDVDVLNDNDLSLSEYVYLKALYLKWPKEDMSKIYRCIDRIEEDSLQERQFVRLMPGGTVILRKKAESLFESGNLFDKFMATFPVKAPSGRYLAPVGGGDTVKGQNALKKWTERFKNNPHKERRAIEVLEAEMKWRIETNQMDYMHNVETWLHQGDYENFEYLLEEQKEAPAKKIGNKKDFM